MGCSLIQPRSSTNFLIHDYFEAIQPGVVFLPETDMLIKFTFLNVSKVLCGSLVTFNRWGMQFTTDLCFVEKKRTTKKPYNGTYFVVGHYAQKYKVTKNRFLMITVR